MEEIISISLLEKQLDLLGDFKQHLVESKKPVVTYSGYNYRNNFNPPCDDREIYFYEFSDTSRQPRKFTKVSEFIAWAKSVNIFISSYTENQLKTHPVNYGSCYYTSATLIVRHTFEELKIAVDRYRNSYSYNSNNARCYANGYDVDDQWADYWD